MLLNQLKKNEFFFANFYEKTLTKSSYNNEVFRFIKKFNLPAEMEASQDFYMADDILLIGTGGNLNKITTYDISQKQTNKILFNDVDKKLFSKNNSYIFKSLVSANRRNTKIVLTYQNIGIIELYDFNLNLLKSISINRTVDNQLKEIENLKLERDLFYASISLFTSDQYIYVLYFGESGKKISSKSICHVLKFNWNLQLLETYELDRLISLFIVDEKKDEIIGTDPNNENKPFVKYEFQSFE